MKKENLVFLDTETTGLNPDSRLCQLAYKFQGREADSLFKPPVLIEIEAMSVSHITNRMVEDKEEFQSSQMMKELKDIFLEGNILVAHNASFDKEILRREGLEVSKMIDTKKVAQHLDENSDIPRYGLQFLRYYHDLEVENAIAHSAIGDVRVLERLFEHYYGIMEGMLGDEKNVILKMLEISEAPVLIKKFTFGKYNGERVSDVFEKDPGYLNWLLRQKLEARNNGLENDENWIHTLEYYLKPGRLL